MNQTDLLARVRESAKLEDTAVDYTDALILRHLNEQLTQVYERGIVRARQGYWKKTLVQLITAGRAQYRMPPRSVTGGLERLQIAYDNTFDWIDLYEVDEAQASNYELQAGRTATTVRYVMRGDVITLLPAPDATNYALRLHYYVRPSRIAAAQGTPATFGLVTAVNTTARTITVSAVPQSITEAGAATTITSGSTAIDVVSPFGWHELQLVNEAQTLAGSVFTITNTLADLTTIQTGDFVRASDQTDWPAIPDDFHRSLADAAAVKILLMRTFGQAAAELAESLGADLARFGDLIKPRVQASAKPLVMPPLYRGQRRGWLVKYP